MSHTITDPSKLTVQTLSTTMVGLHTAVQGAIRTLAAGDKIVVIITIKDIHSNQVQVYIVFEDQ